MESLRGRYIEPFLGGGAVFFSLLPANAFLSDLNPHLIETYTAIRDSPHEVIRLLQGWDVSASTFYRIRTWNPDDQLQRAARFLFLNRTSFAGIYRENRYGEYNVPFGGGDRTHHLLIESDVLLRASQALASTSLICRDFECAVRESVSGDVVYCDPPYPAMQVGGFARYNGQIFGWGDQIRLAKVAREAQARGVTIIVSNALDERVEHLYPTAQVHLLERRSRVSRTTAGRRRVREVLFVLSSGL